MNIDPKVAGEVAGLLLQSNQLCNESLHVLKANETIGTIQVYGRLVGEFMGHGLSNILNPIWQAYPELLPPQLSETYEETKPSLTPESTAAIQAFLEHTAHTLARIQQLLPPEERQALFRYDGLPEVEEAAANIGDFLVNPRFSDKPPAA